MIKRLYRFHCDYHGPYFASMFVNERLARMGTTTKYYSFSWSNELATTHSDTYTLFSRNSFRYMSDISYVHDKGSNEHD